MDAHYEEFGERRLTDLLAHRSGGAEECRSRIMAAVTQFANGAFPDDATVLVLTVN
jgi:serine phosphatase RsbU (regulator of sigma subunit)